jgi:hypothetical protein
MNCIFENLEVVDVLDWYTMLSEEGILVAADIKEHLTYGCQFKDPSQVPPTAAHNCERHLANDVYVHKICMV